MRLLRSTTLELSEFFNAAEVPTYAILSHTWEKEEVTHQEMKSPTSQTRQKAGFLKILRAANLAKSKGYDYIWIDTCCIDKSSSAELTEAINSMYKWYKQSGVCFVFLSDVSIDPKTITKNGLKKEKIGEDYPIQSCLRSCRWITRGWTLQELIAPNNVLFFDSNSNYLGDKRSWSWDLYTVTGIDVMVLESGDPSAASTAERMSWAAKRKTTRLEDVAYCLMGIFDVNMPLLYGEGDRAFIRLQEEILKSSDDHSLFAWAAQVDSRFSYRGLLARSPAEFPSRSFTSDSASLSQVYDDYPTSITNKGIRMTLPLVPWSKIKQATHLYQYSSVRPYEEHQRKNDFEDENYFVALLNYEDTGIILVQLAGQNQYARADADLHLHMGYEGFEFKFETIYIRQNVRLPRNHHSSRLLAFHVSYNNYLSDHKRKISVTSPGKSLEFNKDANENVFELRSLNGLDDTTKVLIFRLEAASGERAITNEYFKLMEGMKVDWLNRWTGVVSVVMKWNSQTGAFCFQALYSGDGTSVEDSQLVSYLDRAKQPALDSDKGIMQEILTIPVSGPRFLQIGINMYTKLVGNHPVIAVDIREYMGNPDATS